MLFGNRTTTLIEITTLSQPKTRGKNIPISVIFTSGIRKTNITRTSTTSLNPKKNNSLGVTRRPIPMSAINGVMNIRIVQNRVNPIKGIIGNIKIQPITNEAVHSIDPKNDARNPRIPDGNNTTGNGNQSGNPDAQITEKHITKLGADSVTA